MLLHKYYGEMRRESREIFTILVLLVPAVRRSRLLATACAGGRSLPGELPPFGGIPLHYYLLFTSLVAHAVAQTVVYPTSYCTSSISNNVQQRDRRISDLRSRSSRHSRLLSMLPSTNRNLEPEVFSNMTTTEISIRKANLASPEDRTLLVYLLNEYAEDAMGGGESLSETTKETLAEKMFSFPTSHVWFAYSNDGSNEVGCGLCTCFEGFSTFAAKRLINIHDMAVLPAYRGRGIASRLMAEVERYCQEEGDFCKLTLEVLSNNHPAKRCYAKYGFAPYELGEDAGHAEFWQKKL